MKIKLFLKLVVFSGALVVSSLAFSSPANAVTASDWKAGNIIDDSLFFDGSSMNVTDIQNFLNSQVATCDTWGTKMHSSGVTRAQYGSSIGVPPPYICVKDYYENPTTHATNFNSTASIPSGAKSAAQIIYEAAVRYNVNPKVILVTIKKEAADNLLGDDWPWASQYRSALGYGCPDTAPCDAEYYGFYNQVENAAKQFRRYATYPSEYRYKTGQTNFIQYNPNAACSGTNVYIESQATAGLYNYTPYQPNAAALANMYGTGDGCSAYGNRNFWRIWNDWFGDTHTPNFAAKFRAQSDDPYVMTENNTTIYMQFINTGTKFWKDDLTNFAGYLPTHLATTDPINRWSDFRSSQWPSGSRAAIIFTKVLEADGYTLATDQHTVFPGQIAEYQIELSVPFNYPGGVYSECFQPILEGATNFSLGAKTCIALKVVKSTYTAEYYSQGSYLSLTTGGEEAETYFRFKNSGNTTWYDDTSVPEGKYPVHLASTWPINRVSNFQSNWPYATRPNVTFTKVFEADGTTLAQNQHTVLPGQIADFTFRMKASLNLAAGFYQEYFQPILEGAPGWSWDMGGVAWMGVNVKSSSSVASYSSQSAYVTTWPGESAQNVYFDFKNSGNTTWYDDTSVPEGKYPVHLASTWPINRVSNFQSNWPYATRPNVTFTKVFEADGTTLAQNQHTVLPGQIARFEFLIQIPTGTKQGFYQEYFQPILEGAPGWSWDMGGVAWMGVNVK